MLRLTVPLHPELRSPNHRLRSESQRFQIPDGRLADLARHVEERLIELPRLGIAPEELDHYAQRVGRSAQRLSRGHGQENARLPTHGLMEQGMRGSSGRI